MNIGAQVCVIQTGIMSHRNVLNLYHYDSERFFLTIFVWPRPHEIMLIRHHSMSAQEHAIATQEAGFI